MFNDFPNLHPLVIHFPIVLILLSAALQAVLLFKDYYQIKWATLLIMGLAFLSAVLASYVFHAHAGELNTKASGVFERHEKYAFYTVWLSGITFLLQGIDLFYKLHRPSFRILVFIAALVSVVLLLITAHQGARLVYVEGVGPQGMNLMNGGHHASANKEAGRKGMDHSKMNMQNGKDNMKGMDHSKMNMQSGKDNMKGMDHSKMNMQSGKGNMKGMDHSKMNMQSGKDNMKGMDHSKMNMQSGKDNMKGMDHSKMNMQNGMNNMKGMGQMKYNYLIDSTKPYDNNPVRKQINPNR